MIALSALVLAKNPAHLSIIYFSLSPKDPRKTNLLESLGNGTVLQHREFGDSRHVEPLSHSVRKSRIDPPTELIISEIGRFESSR